MPDVDKTLAGLVTIKVYFETKADSEANYGKWLMLHWAEVCRDAAELIESMKGEASDG